MQKFCLALVVAVACATWTDLYKFPWTGTPLQLMLAVQCPNTTMCLIAGGQGNSAEGVYYTTDDFKTATRAQMDSTGLLLLDLRMGSATHGVAGGVGAAKVPGLLYTRNSLEWKSSDDLWLLVAQSLARESDEKFYMIGSVNALTGATGVAVSTTGGYLWENKVWPSTLGLPGAKGECAARYGSFQGDTWFVSAGSFPGNNSNSEIHWISRRHGVHKSTGKIVRAELSNRFAPKDDNGYTAAIVKTTDAGSTWSVIYNSTDDFYFNDIECSDAQNCLACGEGFSQDGSSDPGARIMKTTDGGSTWTKAWQGADGTSVLRMKCLSATVCWAGVTTLSPAAAEFYTTTDGGSTWTMTDSLKGIGEVMSIDFVDSTVGYAAGITETQLSTPLKYTSS